MYTEANYTQPIGDKFSLAFHVGYSWGDYWEKSIGEELFDYAVQANYTAGNFTIFAQVHRHRCQRRMQDHKPTRTTTSRAASIGVMTTFPWGK